MANLKDYLADAANPNAVMRKPQPGRKQAKGNIIALGMVGKNILPDFGATYTPAGGGSSVTLSGMNVAAQIKLLCFAGVANFFGNGTVNGKKGDPDEMKESAVFGTRTMARPTGEIEDTINLEFKWFYQNIEFFNRLRFGADEWDFYVFTDRTVEVIRFDTHEPTVHKIGHTKDGDAKKDIIGKFSITYTADGELVPEGGVLDSMLLDSDLKLTFGTTTVTGLAAVTGVANRYTLAASTAGILTPTITQTGVAGLKFAIFKNSNEAIPVGEPVTINTATGVVNIGTSMTTGSYRYTIVAENATGVMGTLSFIVDHA